MSLLRPILGWLRAGYPQGVPQEDYIALLGVLQRHLTDAEIVVLVEQLRARRGAEPLSREHIRTAAQSVLRGHASEDDVRRVAARLAAGGWPLSDEPLQVQAAVPAGGREPKQAGLEDGVHGAGQPDRSWADGSTGEGDQGAGRPTAG